MYELLYSSVGYEPTRNQKVDKKVGILRAYQRKNLFHTSIGTSDHLLTFGTEYKTYCDAPVSSNI
jgi:hypothetical protein